MIRYDSLGAEEVTQNEPRMSLGEFKDPKWGVLECVTRDDQGMRRSSS